MLSSRKEEDLLEAATQTASLPSNGTFGKVFNSLQGLQERLDDFSLNDLSKAIDKTKTLSVRLAELQQSLRRLSAIRNFANEAHSAVEKAVLEIYHLANLDVVTPSSHLAGMTQARRLIKFPRASLVASDAIPLDAKTPTQPDVGNRNGNARTPQELEYPTAVPATGNLDPDKEWSLAADFSAFDPGDEWTLESGESTVPTDEPFVECDPSEPEATETPEADQTDNFYNSSANAATATSPEDKATDALSSALPGSEHEPTVPAEEQPPPAATTTPSVESKALVPAGTDFDQRLLDDLIKDYGEFASSPYVPVPIKPKKEATTARDDNQIAHSPLTADEDNSPTRHLPSIQKEGEIDRKLKKLIKDYGEYDLYSRQSPVNLKTGVIGAFLLLGVIFGAFYFFSAPKTVGSSQPSAITESMETRAPLGANVRNGKTPDSTKTTKGTDSAATDLP